ncbi:MAG: DinB family protein [Pirellula sp.]|nr:DinB family protein [Pirellula sp.]
MNDNLPPDTILAVRDSTIQQVVFARDYLKSLYETVPYDRWYEVPSGAISSIAWQIGHLTVAQYGLMLFRQRGRAENETELMPGPFRKKFAKGTDPTKLTAESYTPEDLLRQMEVVFLESITLCSNLSAEALWEPTEMPYACYPRKLGALMFCPLHEMLHAGQIGVLRRSLGFEPVR